MRNKFEREMSELEAEMLKMSKFVVNVINDAMKALRKQLLRDLAKAVLTGSRRCGSGCVFRHGIPPLHRAGWLCSHLMRCRKKR